MNLTSARIISFLFNPVIVLAILPYVLVYKSLGDSIGALGWTGYTLVFLLIMALFIIYGVRRGMFTDIDISKRQQRPLLFLICIFMGLVYVCGLFLFHAPRILFVAAFGIIGGVLVASFINNFIKASIHTATISALFFTLAMVYGGYYLFFLLFIPLVAWARIKEKRHTLAETIIGGILGILLSLIVYILAKYLFLT